MESVFDLLIDPLDIEIEHCKKYNVLGYKNKFPDEYRPNFINGFEYDTNIINNIDIEKKIHKLIKLLKSIQI